MGPVDLMCGIVVNCQGLNCRACDNIGFLGIGCGSRSSWAAELVGRWSSSAAAGGTGARPVSLVQLVRSGCRCPVYALGVDRIRAGCSWCALQLAPALDMLAAFLIHSHSLAMPQKLTRKQISEGLDQIPVELLLSAGPNKKPAITSKQREFARNVALGKSKAESYRLSHKRNATPATMAGEPYKLAANPRIATEIAAYQLAIEAEKHRTPAQLKALLVQQLVQHSLDDDFPPAQRVQCLKLLGSLFEVGAFVERKEITTVNKSGDIRARLMATLQLVQDVEPKASDDDAAAASLLAELAAPVQEGACADPTAGAGPDAAARPPEPLTHTVLHEGSSEKNIQKFSSKSFRGDASDIGQTTEKFEDMD